MKKLLLFCACCFMSLAVAEAAFPEQETSFVNAVLGTNIVAVDPADQDAYDVRYKIVTNANGVVEYGSIQNITERERRDASGGQAR